MQGKKLSVIDYSYTSYFFIAEPKCDGSFNNHFDIHFNVHIKQLQAHEVSGGTVFITRMGWKQSYCSLQLGLNAPGIQKNLGQVWKKKPPSYKIHPPFVDFVLKKSAILMSQWVVSKVAYSCTEV